MFNAVFSLISVDKREVAFIIQLVERDYIILKEIYRWRVCLGRHVQELIGFSSRNACEQRLRKLIKMGYLERKHILYGVPGLYFLTHKGKVLINVSRKVDKIRSEQILHDIAVLDTAIFLMRSKGITAGQITSEKELHMQDGFGKRVHRPDFVINKNEKITCVEVELNLKAKNRMDINLEANYLNYDYQLWIVPKKSKIEDILVDSKAKYTNITILYIEMVQNDNRRN
jgi:hypothetical protein